MQQCCQGSMVGPWALGAKAARAAQRCATGVGAIAFLAAASQAVVFLPHTGVPLSLQPQAVLLVGAVLGPVHGPAAVLAWLIAGALGAPVFALAQSGAALAGPWGGYLWSYLVAAPLVARWGQSARARGWAAWMLAQATILAIGGVQLGATVGWPHALAWGVWPFVLADALKGSATWGALCLARRLANRR